MLRLEQLLQQKIPYDKRRTTRKAITMKNRLCQICNRQKFNHTFKETNECKRKTAKLKKLNKN